MKLKSIIRSFALVTGVAAAIGLAPAPRAQTIETILDGTSFSSVTALEAEWNYGYPWGDTHNGSAKMYPSQLSLDGGVLTITAETPDPESTYKYRSGTIHLKESVCINEQYPEWSFYGEFRAPYATGTWPAFWITHAGAWTHEVDILEYKGDRWNWFNTYDGGWETTKVQVSDNLEAWHSYELIMYQANGTDVTTEFYLDGVLKGTHTLSGGMNKCFWVIINLQMEGSSGSPGPTGPTYYHARNVVIQRTVTPPPPGPPTAPANLSAAGLDGEVILGWDANTEWDLSHYNVYSSTTSGGPYDFLASTTENGFAHQNLVNGTTYYYVVTAVDLDTNESSTSTEASATPTTLYALAVENHSFEQPGTTKQTNWENVPGWNSDSVASDSGVEADYPTTDGLWRGFLMGSDPSVWNQTGNTTRSGESFVLELDAKSAGGNQLAVDLYYQSGSSRVVFASATLNLGSSYARYVISAPANAASVGHPIGIELDNPGGGWVAFDNIRLKSNLAPPQQGTPAAPSGLTAGARGSSRVDLEWNDNSNDETKFEIERSTDNNTFIKIAEVGANTTTYRNSGLSSKTTYYYRVRACNNTGCSGYSNIASATMR